MRIRVWLFYHYPDGCIPKNTRRKRNKVARDFSNNGSLSLFSTALRQSKCGSFYHERTYLVHIVGRPQRLDPLQDQLLWNDALNAANSPTCPAACRSSTASADSARPCHRAREAGLPSTKRAAQSDLALERSTSASMVVEGKILRRWRSSTPPPRSEARRSSPDPPGRVSRQEDQPEIRSEQSSEGQDQQQKHYAEFHARLVAQVGSAR